MTAYILEINITVIQIQKLRQLSFNNKRNNNLDLSCSNAAKKIITSLVLGNLDCSPFILS
jgi:hypothetical protein